eukprot:SAG11_NODE_9352_length_919_cov_2.048780_2_plen_165_part_00
MGKTAKLKGKGNSQGNGKLSKRGDATATGSGSGYVGYRFSARDREVARVDLASVTPQTFYKDFVAARRPCILQGELPGASFGRWLDDSYLVNRAGKKRVEVEKRGEGPVCWAALVFFALTRHNPFWSISYDMASSALASFCPCQGVLVALLYSVPHACSADLTA